MEDPKLKAYFKFDESDLEANRTGDFSEPQRVRLIKTIKRFSGAGGCVPSRFFWLRQLAQCLLSLEEIFLAGAGK